MALLMQAKRGYEPPCGQYRVETPNLGGRPNNSPKLMTEVVGSGLDTMS